MKSLEFNLMLLMLLGLSLIIDPSRVVLVESQFQNLGTTITTDDGHHNRRILHQPLFPVSSAPPPVAAEAEPPPPESSGFPGPDEPFFPEVPTNPTPDQTQTPPAPSASNVSSTTVPMATQPTNSNKKVAIAISVGIVTLGMLSALAFFLYRHRVNHPSESQKLVAGNSERFTEELSSASNRPDPLYLGTVQPSSRRGGGGGGGDNEGTEEATGSSPYQKLRSIRSSELHRPSPELQPLPPLNREPRGSSPPPISYEAQYRTSPSVMSSEDAFYTPQGSAVSNGSPVPRQIFPANGSASAVAIAAPVSTVKTVIHTANSTPISRRTSPKSRLSNSSPDVKQAIVPSPSPSSSPPSPQSLPLPLPPPLPRLSQSPPKRRPKLPSPPSPPPHSVLPKFINDSTSKTSKNAGALPPPPPPPPPPPMMARKDVCSQKSISVMSVQAEPRNQSIISTPKTSRWQEKSLPTLAATARSNEEEDTDEGKPRLKPLHWDKVRASSDRATVWDQLKSSSFQLNEDMIETLFGCNSKNPPKKELSRRSTLPPPEQENRVLDPKKSQNIAILLRALNVTRDEVTEALLDGNPESLGAELLETLVKMAPTKEEELKLKDYRGDISKLGSAERFLKAVLDIPFSFKRVDAMLYRANFDAEVNYLRKSFETLEAACEELRNSRLFMKLLEAVLRTGNRMNVGTNRGDARAFKLDTLLKLVDIKGIDGKTTLLHFVVQEIIRSEGAGSGEKTQNPLNKMNQKGKDDNNQKQDLQIVAGLGRELANVKKAAGMDSDVLSSYVSKLEAGLDKVRLVLQYENSNTQGKFFEVMKLFLNEAKEEILRVKADDKKALLHVKEVTEYFHGDTAKEEAHPFRIFMVVRDFLAVLDQVCKEVGKMQNGMVGAARSFRISASASLPVLNRFNIRKEESSDDDSSSS